jgi:hypothetical protein
MASRTVLHAGNTLTVPVATKGRLDDLTRTIYTLFNICTDVMVVDAKEYTVLSQHLLVAKSIILASQIPGAAEKATLASRTVEIPVHYVSVPEFQPQVKPDVALVHDTLRIDTVDLELESRSAERLNGNIILVPKAASIYTIVTARIDDAKTRLMSGTHAPVVQVLVAGIKLRDFYTDEPAAPVSTLARLFGARFVSVQDRYSKSYWVLEGQLSDFKDTLTRLGLLV